MLSVSLSEPHAEETEGLLQEQGGTGGWQGSLWALSSLKEPFWRTNVPWVLGSFTWLCLSLSCCGVYSMQTPYSTVYLCLLGVVIP